MNDTTEFWRDVREDKKKRHAENKKSNREIFQDSGLVFKDKGEVFLFRHKNGPSCDFYPSSNKWKVNGKRPKYITGSAEAFVNWYRKRVKQ